MECQTPPGQYIAGESRVLVRILWSTRSYAPSSDSQSVRLSLRGTSWKKKAPEKCGLFSFRCKRWIYWVFPLFIIVYLLKSVFDRLHEEPTASVSWIMVWHSSSGICNAWISNLCMSQKLAAPTTKNSLKRRFRTTQMYRSAWHVVWRTWCFDVSSQLRLLVSIVATIPQLASSAACKWNTLML